MADDRTRDRERDLILAPNESCFIQDATKGAINTYCGPFKTSLAGTDVPVIFNEKTKKFERRSLEDAVQQFVTAPEAWYIALKNVEVSDNKHPQTGACSSTPELKIGHKVNVSGPVSFALWPGQMAKVIKGHHLRSNQYLIVRVYDEEAARKNLAQAVVKRQRIDESEQTALPTDAPDLVKEDELVLGKLIVIKGTDVSFYIPPTGIEVVVEKTDHGERYVRDAVTLERLEYCLLLDQSGTKRYEQGPQVVFPRATENFVEKNVGTGDKKIMTRKFRSIELSEISGIYVKVIAPYTEGGKSYKVGDELFITGKEQMIYFPREEHAVVKYGSQEIHYGIAIPEGEARYVMDRMSGKIKLQKGPCVFLPDPRKEVIVRRILDLKTCEMMYPGNREAVEYNAKLLNVEVGSDGEIQSNGGEEAVEAMNRTGYVMNDSYQSRTVNVRTAARGFGGDAFDRKNKHTKPRMVVLDTKYEGAVTMDVWNGYAIKLVNKTGESRVVTGPATVLLEYDELPQVMQLSRGKPKVDSQIFKTVYLRIKANKVSDIIQVETRDFCKMNVHLSYRVSFTGDKEKWFDVDNYVKYLTDHLRSRLRNAVSQLGVEEFYAHSADIIRDIVLGKTLEAAPRTGLLFEENGMKVYDVEIFNVTMEDKNVEEMLVSTQRNVISQTLVLQHKRRELVHSRELEEIKQELIDVENKTRESENIVKLEEYKRKFAIASAEVSNANLIALKRHQFELETQGISDEIHAATLLRERNTKLLAHEFSQKMQEQKLEMLKAEVDAVTSKAAAISPELIAALQAFGDKELLEKLATAIGPMTILGGGTVVDVLQKAFAGTKIAETIGELSQVTLPKTTKK